MLTPTALLWAGGECWACYQRCTAGAEQAPGTVHTSDRKIRLSSTELLILKPADGLQVAPCTRWERGVRGEWAEHVGVIKQPNAELPSCWKSWSFQRPQAMSGFGLEEWVVGWFRCEPVLALGLETMGFLVVLLHHFCVTWRILRTQVCGFRLLTQKPSQGCGQANSPLEPALCVSSRWPVVSTTL